MSSSAPITIRPLLSWVDPLLLSQGCSSRQSHPATSVFPSLENSSCQHPNISNIFHLKQTSLPLTLYYSPAPNPSSASLHGSIPLIWSGLSSLLPDFIFTGTHSGELIWSGSVPTPQANGLFSRLPSASACLSMFWSLSPHLIWSFDWAELPSGNNLISSLPWHHPFWFSPASTSFAVSSPSACPNNVGVP